jgi:hypothetical protein
MKKFNELSVDDQKKAIDLAFDQIVFSIVEDDIVPSFLEDYSDVIDEAFQQAEKVQTPWFASEYLFEKIKENPAMDNAIASFAHDIAQKAFYKEGGDYIFSIV